MTHIARPMVRRTQSNSITISMVENARSQYDSSSNIGMRIAISSTFSRKYTPPASAMIARITSCSGSLLGSDARVGV